MLALPFLGHQELVAYQACPLEVVEDQACLLGVEEDLEGHRYLVVEEDRQEVVVDLEDRRYLVEEVYLEDLLGVVEDLEGHLF